MIQFRFPHAVAFYCNKSGFPFAVKKAMEFAVNARKLPSDEFKAAAAAFVDRAMKARRADFDERISANS